MCEATVYMARSGGTETLLSDVVRVKRDGDELILTSLLGERKIVRGRIAEADFLAHTITIEPVPSAGPGA